MTEIPSSSPATAADEATTASASSSHTADHAEGESAHNAKVQSAVHDSPAEEDEIAAESAPAAVRHAVHAQMQPQTVQSTPATVSPTSHGSSGSTAALISHKSESTHSGEIASADTEAKPSGQDAAAADMGVQATAMNSQTDAANFSLHSVAKRHQTPTAVGQKPSYPQAAASADTVNDKSGKAEMGYDVSAPADVHSHATSAEHKPKAPLPKTPSGSPPLTNTGEDDDEVAPSDNLKSPAFEGSLAKHGAVSAAPLSPPEDPTMSGSKFPGVTSAWTHVQQANPAVLNTGEDGGEEASSVAVQCAADIADADDVKAALEVAKVPVATPAAVQHAAPAATPTHAEADKEASSAAVQRAVDTTDVEGGEAVPSAAVQRASSAVNTTDAEDGEAAAEVVQPAFSAIKTTHAQRAEAASSAIAQQDSAAVRSSDAADGEAEAQAAFPLTGLASQHATPAADNTEAEGNEAASEAAEFPVAVVSEKQNASDAVNPKDAKDGEAASRMSFPLAGVAEKQNARSHMEDRHGMSTFLVKGSLAHMFAVSPHETPIFMST